MGFPEEPPDLPVREPSSLRCPTALVGICSLNGQAPGPDGRHSGHLCPQFLDLMETIDKQREEMARSSR